MSFDPPPPAHDLNGQRILAAILVLVIIAALEAFHLFVRPIPATDWVLFVIAAGLFGLGLRSADRGLYLLAALVFFIWGFIDVLV